MRQEQRIEDSTMHTTADDKRRKLYIDPVQEVRLVLAPFHYGVEYTRNGSRRARPYIGTISRGRVLLITQGGFQGIWKFALLDGTKATAHSKLIEPNTITVETLLEVYTAVGQAG